MNDIGKKIFPELHFPADHCDGGRARNFVKVGDQHKIIRAAIAQPACDAVPLIIFQHPRVFRIGQVINDDMDDFVVEFAKPGTVFLIMQRFGFIGMGFSCFHQYEFVHDIRQFMQPQFQQLQFVKEGKAIVNHDHSVVSPFETFTFLALPRSARNANGIKRGANDVFDFMLDATGHGKWLSKFQIQVERSHGAVVS